MLHNNVHLLTDFFLILSDVKLWGYDASILGQYYNKPLRYVTEYVYDLNNNV